MCALGWVKCREHISLLVILCIIVYVTNKQLFFFSSSSYYYYLNTESTFEMLMKSLSQKHLPCIEITSFPFRHSGKVQPAANEKNDNEGPVRGSPFEQD